MRSDSDLCAVVPAKTAGRQCYSRGSIELRHVRGHLIVCEAVRKACKPQTNRIVTTYDPRTDCQHQLPELTAS